MEHITDLEINNLRSLQPYLKEGVDMQVILNLIRGFTNQGRTTYLGDVTWTDDQLK